MGTSRASTLGEATFNLADYIDAIKPSAVTLPLRGCSFGTILHITVQLLTSKSGFREFEQQRELRERGIQSGPDSHTPSKISLSDETTNDQTDEVISRVKDAKDPDRLSPLEEEVDLNEEYADSATGLDGSSNTFGSLYAEKHETSNIHEFDSLKITVPGDVSLFSHCQSPHTGKQDPSDRQNAASTVSAKGWVSDNAINNELAMASVENNRLKGSLGLAESSYFNLKLEVSSLRNLVYELSAETQRFLHQLAAEISSAKELAKEVSVMKSECLKFKDDISKLKDLNLSGPQIPIPETSENQIDHFVRNTQLQFLKGITIVESKIRGLQSKMYLVPNDGSTEFIYSELDALLDFLLAFKFGNGEITKFLGALPSEIVDVKEITELNTFKDDATVVSGNGLGLDLCQPVRIFQDFGTIPPVSEVSNPLGAVDATKGQLLDLVRELDDAKAEKEALTRKMNQMECYYESLCHELEENQKRLLGELQHLRNEHSTCLYTLSVSKSETDSLHHDMNQQMLQFVDERHELEALNKELERRATTSEAALRRACLNYPIAVDKLQKNLQLLSSQVISMFETNENLIKQALPALPHLLGDLKLIQNPEDGVSKVSKFQNQNSRSISGDILLEDLKRSLRMQEEHYQKVEKELIEIYFINFNLDIYSRALQESLCEADAGIRIMKEKMDELVEELKLSTAFQNQLMIRLQKATDDIHALNEYRSSSIPQCSQYGGIVMQNQLFKDKLLSPEKKYLLIHKLEDLESALMESQSNQITYEACLAENAELSLRLKQEGSENEKLANEISLLKEKSMILKAKSTKLVMSKENLEENLKFVHDKLANLLASYDMQFCSFSLNLESVGVKDVILQLEEIQHYVYAQYCELMEENQNLKNERAISDVSLGTFRSEILMVKQKFKSAIEGMVIKLDVSNALVDKLQAELESMANKLDLSSEIEEKYFELNKVLLADLANFEIQLQKLTCKNDHPAQEVSGLDAVAEEPERAELTVSKLMHEKQELSMCLHGKTDECTSCLKEASKLLHVELHEEKVYKDELEGKVRDIIFHLNKDLDKLLNFEQEKSELVHVRELTPDLGMAKSRLAHLLSQQNVFVEELKRSSSHQAGFEGQLLEMHDYSLATDVKLIYVANHYEALIEELVQKLASSDDFVRELQKGYHDTEAMLNQCLAGEANWREEKLNLLTGLASLRFDLEASENQKNLLSDSNNEMRNQLVECRRKLKMMESDFSDVQRLKNMMIDAEDEISNLTDLKEELGILVAVFKSKIHELSASLTLLEEYKDELTILRSQCNELSYKLSEQVLKTDEFKNLATHLKELKDKAEAECLVARGKRETEVPHTAGQDSLRIAFIKEQYETQIQELKHQVSTSKNHEEEMLLKLQDSVDEIENRKKSDAVNTKKNEELLFGLSALEAELRSALAEKREKNNAYDRTKAELECALLSLECCKEEKEKLGSSLLEFEAENSRLVNELTLMKAQLENLKSSTNFEKDEFGENADLTEPGQLQIIQDAARTALYQNPELLVIDELPQGKDKNLDVSSKSLEAQRLRSSMEHLHEELKKMKNENKVFSISHDVAPGSQMLQRGIMKLHKANEELGSMFPLSNEIYDGGDALEKVLALGIELAEALKAKNKSKVISQSSFLEQHSDEEAVFKSFRDINELIKEMLELKERHASLEAELREMHDRYSQLSLQFAEVEGERQKLKITLKNVCASRKLVTFNRSSSDNVMDHLS